MTSIIEIQDLCKSYSSSSTDLNILDSISFSVPEKSTLSIVGPSGSGKTTLLGLIAGLDYPTSGSVKLNGTILNNLTQEELAEIRNRDIGFIFQSFQLLSTLTALENVMVPMELQGKRRVEEKAKELLEKVGLKDRMNHYPVQLSGGEQQRVAISRSFINSPKILFADEPTGNLDGETSNLIEDLLFNLNKDLGTTLVLVTHDLELANRTQRIIQLKGGQIVNQKERKETNAV